jgi:hypothetical protein
MSAEGGHLGWRSGSLDTILKIDQQDITTILFKVALNTINQQIEYAYQLTRGLELTCDIAFNLRLYNIFRKPSEYTSPERNSNSQH